MMLPVRLSICQPLAPRNVSTCSTLFAPAIHSAVPASAAAVTAKAASAATDRRPRHGTTRSGASTSGQSLKAPPIASAAPSGSGRCRRQAATARIAAAVDQASIRLKNSPITGITVTAKKAAATTPQPHSSDETMTASPARLSSTTPRPNEARPRGSRARDLNTISVAIGCSTW